MGVIYKLRQDVVDFIVQSKRADASWSCRKFVGVIKEKFGLPVSKSSVGAVLKEFHLSSPVGRHPLYKAPKNFSIPKAKKETLLKNVIPFLKLGAGDPVQGMLPAPEEVLPLPAPEQGDVVLPVPAPEPEPEPEPVPVPEPVAEPLVPESCRVEALPHLSEQDDVALSVPAAELLPVPGAIALEPPAVRNIQESGALLFPAEAMSLRADPLAPAEVPPAIDSMILVEKQEDAPRTLRPLGGYGDGGRVYLRLGAAFLWYLFKNACGTPRCGEIILRAMGAEAAGLSADAAETLLFLPFFGEHRAGAEDDALDTLWQLAGIDAAAGRNIVDRAEAILKEKDAAFQLKSEVAMAFMPARYVRLKAGEIRFYIDMIRPKVHVDFIDTAAGGLPVQMAVARVVDRLVTNIEPILLDIPGTGLPPWFARLAALLEAEGEAQWTSAELFGNDDQCVADLGVPPHMRRGFIARAALTESELAQIDYEMIGNKKEFSVGSGAAPLFFHEGSLAVEGVSRPLRALKISQGNAEFVLLSNISDPKYTSECVIAMVESSEMGLSTNDNRTAPKLNGKTEHIFGMDTTLFRDIDSSATLLLEEGCPETQTRGLFAQDVYDLPGTIKADLDYLIINFITPDTFPHRDALSGILQQWNRIGLKDTSGRTLVFLSRIEVS